MSTLLAPSPLVELEKAFTTQAQDSKSGLYLSLETYWQKYYEHGDLNYEWNNGKLEEKGVSQYFTTLLYNWFMDLLRSFLRANEIAQIVNLETGFKLNLAEGQKVRKPDLGIVLHNNPVPMGLKDRTYQGIFDLCVEAVSDSTPKERARDVLVKKEEYAESKVKEYYILDATGQDMTFSRLNKYGIYEKIKPTKGDVIQSEVLPGFQFRIRDLYRLPPPKELVKDPVYSGFIMIEYQAEKERADEQTRRADEEKRAKEAALLQAEAALLQAKAEKQEKERLQAKLKELGISLD